MAKSVGIVLAAGQGKRMKSSISKQYLLMDGKPILAYALKAFEESFIDEVVLVVEAGREDYCRRELVEKYQFHKVTQIIPGGKERCHSVFCGLQCIEDADYVYIHDGARPFLSQEILERGREAVVRHEACVVGMPVKDTIKIADASGFVESTPERSYVWQVQTPQIFSYPLIKKAYEKLLGQPNIKEVLLTLPEERPFFGASEIPRFEKFDQVTDDAMVAERMLGQKVYLVEGSYENIKITTQEDLAYGEVFCKKYWTENERKEKSLEKCRFLVDSLKKK